MPEVFEEMKRYVRFGEQDHAHLQEMLPLLRPSFGSIVDEFYRRIDEEPGARTVLRDGPAQVQRLKRTLLSWLERLFVGPWDEAYYQERARIGRRHVAIELPQRYNFAAMNVIREGLHRAIFESTSEVELVRGRVAAVDKLLDLELAIMTHTYSEDHAAQLKRNERLATFGLMMSAIGHELRNPLGVIESSVYLLSSRVAGTDAEKHIKKIRSQVARSNRIIADMLEIVRDRSPTRTRCQPSILAEKAVRAIHEDRGREVECSLEPTLPSVRIDEGQIQQLLLNLLGNALDAAGPSGRVALSVRLRDGRVEFEVADDGPGVDPSVASRLFEPLVTTKRNGIGLGLALCRKLAEANHATLEVGEARLGGASFVLRLPSVGAEGA